jgi:hypothetical protein
LNKNILNTGVQNFINNNLNTDIMSVLLRKPIFDAVSNKELVEQIEAKKKCKDKLPSWYNSEKIYYPNKLNIEQSSSEITAAYKSRIVSGKSLVDLTGGLGVDSFFFSKKIQAVVHCEISYDLSEIAAHNFKVLGAQNIHDIQNDGLEFIKGTSAKFDWIYLDPSRRMVNSKKVFMLSDCTPNVVPHLELLLTKSKHVLIKTSPLLDISIGLNQLGNVKELHIVAVNNEVKELLWVIQEGHSDEVKVKTINFKKGNEETYNFVWAEEKITTPLYGVPRKFLYEPNAAILKGGAFKQIARDLKVEKLDEHSHLYTSHELVEFPGRSFRITEVFDYNKKGLKHLFGTKANVTVRNFPESVATIRQKYAIKDGGDDYLFFTTINKSQLKVINCTKIQTTFR